MSSFDKNNFSFIHEKQMKVFNWFDL